MTGTVDAGGMSFDPTALVGLDPPSGDAAAPFPTRMAVNYSVANFGASVFYGLFNYAMPLYLSSYLLPAWLIGLLANERSFVGALIQPLVGRLSDRTHTRLGKRRPFFVVGVPFVCGGLFLLAFHPPLLVMIAVMAVLAFFLAVAWDPYIAMMADLFPPVLRGRVGGLLGVGLGLGNILLGVLALKLWADQEFLVFAIVIVLLVLTWGYTFVTVREPAVPAEGIPPAPAAGPANPVAYIRNVVQYPEAARYTLAMTFFWLGTGGVIPFITLFGVNVLHATNGAEFLLPIAATAANALFAVPLGMLADRTSKKRVVLGGMFGFALVALIGSQAQDMMQGHDRDDPRGRRERGDGPDLSTAVRPGAAQTNGRVHGPWLGRVLVGPAPRIRTGRPCGRHRCPGGRRRRSVSLGVPLGGRDDVD